MHRHNIAGSEALDRRGLPPGIGAISGIRRPRRPLITPPRLFVAAIAGGVLMSLGDALIGRPVFLMLTLCAVLGAALWGLCGE